jgi:sulfatase modifying factor 1
MFAERIGMKFVALCPGRFLMGSPPDEIGREADEQLHQVSLTRGFLMADAPVTNEQYRYKNPDHRSGELFGINLEESAYPCTSVSWLESNDFCDWLSSQDSDWQYSLPTEAEWEYAARGGSNSRFFWGENESLAGEFANIYDRVAMRSLASLPRDGFDVEDGYAGPAPVRSFKPNQYGLYDMLGNVWEMCRNIAYKYPATPLVDPRGPAQGTYFAVRGGDWLAIPFFARLANRTTCKADDKSETVGFRIIARPKGGPTPPQPPQRQLPKWRDVSALFTQTDIDHMKVVSAKWSPPLELDSYESVRHYSMKIYSSVRTDRMPTDPVPKWTDEMKETLRNWIYAGHPS